MSIVSEFKEFALRGNVVDLAVGVIIGAAFGKIVSSLVNDIVMPFMGLLLAGVNFNELSFVLKAAVLDAKGKEIAAAVVLKYGAFIQTVVDFLIVAFVIFVAIKALNTFKRKQEQTPTITPVQKEEVQLLTEIRDALKSKLHSS